MIRILLADDHSIFREGLKRILAERQDMVIAVSVLVDGSAVLIAATVPVRSSRAAIAPPCNAWRAVVLSS